MKRVNGAISDNVKNFHSYSPGYSGAFTETGPPKLLILSKIGEFVQTNMTRVFVLMMRTNTRPKPLIYPPFKPLWTLLVIVKDQYSHWAYPNIICIK